MARKEKRYHYIYKTTCKITNKFYVGMHSTDNLEDGYMGSGKRLGYSIRKHGKENHITEIIEFLPNRSSLKKRESEIINEQFLKETLCMNLQLGGGGGFSSEEHQKKAQAASHESYRNRLKTDDKFRDKVFLNLYQNMKKYHKSGKHKYDNFTGKKHTEETKQKMRDKASQRIGDKSSQYGTCWITNGSENKKIKKTETIPDAWVLGRSMRLKTNGE